MDRFFQKTILSFSEAWNLLFDFYPFGTRIIDSLSSGEDDADDGKVLCFTPIVGVLLFLGVSLLISH